MTTPDHTLTDAEREVVLKARTHGGYRCDDHLVRAVERILADTLAAVEAVRDHYAILAGLPVSAADVVDRLDVALGGGE